MRFRTPELFLGVFLTIAVFAMGFVVASSMPPPSQQTETADHPQAANEGAERTSEKQIAYYTKWLAWFTLALVAVSGIQGYFLLRADKTARIAADAAKESADAVTQSERAHIFIKIVSQSFVEGWTSANLERITPDGQVSVPVTVKFAFKNFGKTPAILQEVSRDIVIAPNFPDEVDYIPVEFVPTERVVASDEATDTWQCTRTHISKADLNAIIRAQTSYWFFGRVLYNDIFGKAHEHRFIYRYNSSRGWNTFHHPEYSKNT